MTEPSPLGGNWIKNSPSTFNVDIDTQAKRYLDLLNKKIIPFVPPSPAVKQRINELIKEGYQTTELEPEHDEPYTRCFPLPSPKQRDVNTHDRINIDPIEIAISIDRFQTLGESIEELSDKIVLAEEITHSMQGTEIAAACLIVNELIKKTFQDAGLWPKITALHLQRALAEITETDTDSQSEIQNIMNTTNQN